MWQILKNKSIKHLNRYIIPILCLHGIAFSQDMTGYDQTFRGTDVTLEMLAIPAGSLVKNASENSGTSLNETMHIDAFWVSKHEITWDLYRLFLYRDIDPLDKDEKGSAVALDVDAVSGATIPYVDMSLGMGTDGKLPVCNVTQLAASKFCEWLSAMTGDFYRLPTEAEWEYAARAGSQNTYFFDDRTSLLSEYAWYAENSDGTYHKVGEKKPNPFGLHDIYGNVSEWVLGQVHHGTLGKGKLAQKGQMVIRGGSFRDPKEDVGSLVRVFSSPNWKTRDPQFPKSKWWNTDAPFVGFRIVRPHTPPPKETFKEYWNTTE